MRGRVDDFSFVQVSHARVFAKTLLHVFSNSYNHTEWYTLFFAKRDCRKDRRVACQKLTTEMFRIVMESISS